MNISQFFISRPIFAGVLSLLIFIGEAVRDAFDPRRSATGLDSP